MHNLFLGLAEHYFKRLFIEKGILSQVDITTIQQQVDKVLVSPDIGRIPLKIASLFYSFTAEQYKNWVIYYSII